MPRISSNGCSEIVKARKCAAFGQIRLENAETGAPVAIIWTTWMLL